tara:strand:- start:247 stop:651 length:405 start_codon:yes stop_codon:yes gene_type:complete
MQSVKFINCDINKDNRGSLISVEAYQQTGCLFKRFFLIQDIKGGVRGGHAHKYTDQILKVIKGSLTINFQYFSQKESIKVDINSKPIFFPKLTWIEMNNIKEDSIILVLSSDEYNIQNSLRDKKNFLEFISKIK